MDDQLGVREKCGVFAVLGHPEAATLTYYGLFALQHRGQESAGIATPRGVRKGMGWVAEALGPADLEALRAETALGHVRYSTTGASRLENAQPIAAHLRFGPVAVAHNGNLVNAVALRRACAERGAAFCTETDTEVILHLMAEAASQDPGEALIHALSQVRGAYALGVLVGERLFVARDPFGIRPLVLGRLGDALLAASETCALDAVGARVLREVDPGEVVELTAAGPKTLFAAPCPARALCLFEFIYLARPDSDLAGRNVHLARKEMGRRLAREAPVEADLVVGVPDSGISAAMGFAEESGLPLEVGLVKNRYIGRTFIQPTQAGRELGVQLKLNAVRGVVAGRRVVLVDDSIVRGTTARRLVALLRSAGAREVHVRVSSPPFAHPCFYGIDIPSADQLLAAGRDPRAMAQLIGADSLAFLSEEAARQAAGSVGFCTACFSGHYPAGVPEEAEVVMAL